LAQLATQRSGRILVPAEIQELETTWRRCVQMSKEDLGGINSWVHREAEPMAGQRIPGRTGEAISLFERVGHRM
jgi:hypothetical protein